MAGTRTELQMIKMSEIQSQEVAWLWLPFIPYGKLTIVQGDPGDGKTTLVLNIAAKAYLVAKKLKLKEFEEWLNQEQNGYKKEIPEYRNITGEIKAWNPYHGWIPMILSAKVADIVSRRPIPNSISSLLDVYNSSEDRVAFSVNGAMTEFFNNSTDSMSLS